MSRNICDLLLLEKQARGLGGLFSLASEPLTGRGRGFTGRSSCNHMLEKMTQYAVESRNRTLEKRT